MSQQINLLNPLLVKQKEVLTAPLMLKVSGVVLVLMLSFAAWSNYRLSQLTQQQQATSSQLAQLKEQLNASIRQHAPRQPSKALQEELGQAEVSFKNRQSLLNYLQGGEFGSQSGFSAYMRAFAVRGMKGLWLTDFSIDDSVGRIAIGGRTLQPDTIPKYIAGLGQEPLLKGREFSALQIRSVEQPAEKAVPGSPEAKSAPHPPVVTEFRLQSIEKVDASGGDKSAIRPEKQP